MRTSDPNSRPPSADNVSASGRPLEQDEQFRLFLRNEIVSILLHTNIAVILLALISWLDVVKSGTSLAWFPYAPAIVLMLLTRFWHECAPASLIRLAPLVLDVTALAVVLGATAVAVLFDRHCVETLNAPVQIALIAGGAFTLYPRRSQNLLRNALLMAVAFVTMLVWDRAYALRIVAQYPIGFVVGSFASHYLLQSRRGQFLGLRHAQSREAHALRQLSKMVLPHQMERVSVGDALEDTMPVAVGNAYIIKFDVIASSTVNHDVFAEALRNTFSDCYAVMAEQYSHVPLQANGYPIKWMGDGFLCSVGFPLAVPAGCQPADLSDSMAERFCDIFTRRMAVLQYRRQLSCGQGIAKGTIEGFYPESGPRLYDLRGTFSSDPIMLATRYEQLRKTILADLGREDSIIVISEPVYSSLSCERRRRYSPWDLTQPDRAIRDDPAARVAYYRLLPCVEAVG